MSVTGLDFDPRGNWLVSSSSTISDGGDGDLEGHLWLRPTTNGLIGLAENSIWRNLSRAEWLTYVGSSLSYRRTFESLPFPDDTSLLVGSH